MTRSVPAAVTTVFLAMALLSGCEDESDPTVFTVEPYVVPCTGETQQSCMVVILDGDTTPQLVYNGIDGYAFAWGKRARIEADVSETGDSIRDASTKAYRMGKELEYESMDSVDFSFSMDPSMEPFYATDTTMFIHGYEMVIVRPKKAPLGAVGAGSYTLDGTLTLRWRSNGTLEALSFTP